MITYLNQNYIILPIHFYRVELPQNILKKSIKSFVNLATLLFSQSFGLYEKNSTRYPLSIVSTW